MLHAEHEICSVYIGRCSAQLSINWNEILAWRRTFPEALQSEITSAKHFTPWFILEWGRIWRDHQADLLALQEESRI
jgi:isopentenyl-diphosphate delta-isomerase